MKEVVQHKKTGYLASPPPRPQSGKETPVIYSIIQTTTSTQGNIVHWV